MITAMILLFVLGYLFIALEHKTGINKTAVALILGILLWTLYIFSNSSLVIGADPEAFQNFMSQHPDYARLSLADRIKKYIVDLQIIDQLGSTCEILFYLLGAMAIVETIDLHQGFTPITRAIKSRNKKKLLWLVALITFFMSSVLDNMTSAIVMIMMIQKLLGEKQERWIFGSIVILAANAGGAWTPIGDVTTIMLWINDNITSGNIMKTLFFPSLVSLALPAWLLSFALKGKLAAPGGDMQAAAPLQISPRQQNGILITGVLCLLAVPVFKSLTSLPPFAGILLTLGILWMYIDILYNRKNGVPANAQFRLPYVLSRIDLSTILFFFGILMAVAALEAIGVLHKLSILLDSGIHNVYLLSGIIGLLSSVIDNVPLVAAAMGMYPTLTPEAAAGMADASYMLNFVADGSFWELLAYCAGTGGSILIIGSAAGVVVMGLEKINFVWYLKKISGIAILGFLAGIGVYYLQHLLFQ